MSILPETWAINEPWVWVWAFAVTETGSVAVVTEADRSLLIDVLVGESGAAVGSKLPLLTEPAFELAALGGALCDPTAPLYIAEPKEYRDVSDSRFPSGSEPTDEGGSLRVESGANGEHGSEAGKVWMLGVLSWL